MFSKNQCFFFKNGDFVENIMEINNFLKKNDLLKVFPVSGNFATQLGNYAAEIIQMTLESA